MKWWLLEICLEAYFEFGGDDDSCYAMDEDPYGCEADKLKYIRIASQCVCNVGYRIDIYPIHSKYRDL